MSIQKLLENNKGTVSSALGKKLGKLVIKGDSGILDEAVMLIRHKAKNVRCGAAKIIEQVAEEKPELAAGYMIDLKHALEVPEPQTRWMIIHTFGLCAKYNPNVARSVYDKALSFLGYENGTCLQDSAIRYLGNIGTLSKKDACLVYKELENCIHEIPKRIPRILESIYMITGLLNKGEKESLREYTEKLINDKKPVIAKWAKKIQKNL